MSRTRPVPSYVDSGTSVPLASFTENSYTELGEEATQQSRKHNRALCMWLIRCKVMWYQHARRPRRPR